MMPAQAGYDALPQQVCGVPGCSEPRTSEDCCSGHAAQVRGPNAHYLKNDGIIDWQAVYVTVEGLRPVNMTWLESVIAAGILRARGMGINQIEDHIGHSLRSRRVKEQMESIAAAYLVGGAA